MAPDVPRNRVLQNNDLRGMPFRKLRPLSPKRSVDGPTTKAAKRREPPGIPSVW